MAVSIKEAKKLLSAHYRKKTNLCLVEGEKVIDSILLDAPHLVEQIFVSGEKKDLLHKYNNENCSVAEISTSNSSALKQTKQSQGVFVVVKEPVINEIAALPDENAIIFDSVSNPDNMGAMIRTALSFGWKNFIFLGTCVSLNNNTLIRASSGYIYKGNYFTAEYTDLNTITNGKITIIADLNGENIDEISIDEKSKKVILVGNEGNGVSEFVYQNLQNEKKIITLPMSYSIDSISVAHASAIFFYKFK